MNINATLIGQSISFVFFVWFCVKFIWPPLTAAMAERQQRIAEGLDNAAKAEKDLADAEARVEAELQSAREEAQRIIEQARQRAAQMIDEAKDDAREEGARELEAARGQIGQEVNSAREALRAEVADLVVGGAERVLKATVDRSVHGQLLTDLAAELSAPAGQGN